MGYKKDAGAGRCFKFIEKSEAWNYFCIIETVSRGLESEKLNISKILGLKSSEFKGGTRMVTKRDQIKEKSKKMRPVIKTLILNGATKKRDPWESVFGCPPADV